MVISMLQVFSINVYVLLDLSATLSFVSPFLDRRFDIIPHNLN